MSVKPTMHPKFTCLKKIIWKNLKSLIINIDPPCGFSKNVSSKERVKTCFLVTFDVIINQIFLENFIKINQVFTR